jgi:HK97 family phage portal protein
MGIRQRIGKWLAKTVRAALEPVTRGWRAFNVRDIFPGAFQSGGDAPTEKQVREGLQVALVYACIRALITDLAKLPVIIRRLSEAGVWLVDKHQTLGRIARRPNNFQTWFQFMCSWLASRFIAGNAYVVKLYRGNVVEQLVVLDPTTVTPLIASDTGAIFYRVSGGDALAGLVNQDNYIIAAEDIIHDRYLPLGHPLIGTSPLERALTAARVREGVLSNSADLYENRGVPPGIMYHPEGADEETLKKAADIWRTQTAEGKIPFVDKALKFEVLAAKYVDNQAAEIAKLSAEEICSAFGVPMWRVGAGTRPTENPEAVTTAYLVESLQWQIEDLEEQLDYGLQLPTDVYMCFDVGALLRMDRKTRAEVHKLELGAGKLSPNEARAEDDLPPVKGGESPMVQQQNYSLEALSKRPPPAAPSSPGTAPGASPPGGVDPEDDPAPESGEDEPAATLAPSPPWRGVWTASGEYPSLGSFVTHKGRLWARVERPDGPEFPACAFDQGAEIGAEPGTDTGAPYWQLASKEDLWK